jgi:hypothetical protein
VLAALPLLLGGLGATAGAALTALYLPVAAALVLLLPGAIPWARDPAERARRRSALAAVGGDLLAFGAGALLPTAAWVACLASRIGGRALVQRLIVEGPAAGAADAISPPAPGALTVGAALLVGAVLVGRAVVRARAVSLAAATRAVEAVGILLGALALGWLAWVLRPALEMGDPDVAVMHVGRAIDHVALSAVFVIGSAFLPRLRSALAGRGSVDAALLCWLHGISALFLAYPRFDVAHLYDATVILLIPGTVLMERTLALFRAPDARRVRWLPLGAACALAVVAATRLWPRVEGQLAWRGGPALAARKPLAAARGGLYATRYETPVFNALDRTVAAVAARTAPGTPVFAYPALPAIYFLSRREPVPLDYFFRLRQAGTDGRGRRSTRRGCRGRRRPTDVVRGSRTTSRSSTTTCAGTSSRQRPSRPSGCSSARRRRAWPAAGASSQPASATATSPTESCTASGATASGTAWSRWSGRAPTSRASRARRRYPSPAGRRAP